MRKIFAALLCAILLTGCSNGVSQEEYDRIVAERDELQAQLDEIESALEEFGLLSGESDETEEIQTNSPDSNSTQEQEYDITVLHEYIYHVIDWYTMRFLIIQNNSDATLEIATSSLAYSEDGTMVAATNGELSALGPGCISILSEYYDTEETISTFETDMDVKEDSYFISVLQDLSVTQNDISEGAIFQITNNGDVPAEFVEGHALFFAGDQLVEYDSTYFVDDDSEIKPGETISEQITAYEEFDRVEFYMTGRRSSW